MASYVVKLQLSHTGIFLLPGEDNLVLSSCCRLIFPLWAICFYAAFVKLALHVAVFILHAFNILMLLSLSTLLGYHNFNTI